MNQDKLFKIQQSLFVPKGQRNDFAKFNYRSCEDILVKLKPLLAENSCVLTMDEDVVQVGENEYVKASATLYEKNGEVVASVKAYARMDKDKKGMDSPQLSGAALSYARKYALAGLFGIDNEKDNDTNDYQKKINTTIETKQPAAEAKQQTKEDKSRIKAMIDWFDEDCKSVEQCVAAIQARLTDEDYKVLAVQRMLDKADVVFQWRRYCDERGLEVKY